MLYCYTSKHGPGLPSSVCYQKWALFHGWICKHLKEHSPPSLVIMGTLSRHHSIMQHVNYTQLGYSKISSTQLACLTKYVNHTYSCLLGESTVHNHENIVLSEATMSRTSYGPQLLEKCFHCHMRIICCVAPSFHLVG